MGCGQSNIEENDAAIFNALWDALANVQIDALELIFAGLTKVIINNFDLSIYHLLVIHCSLYTEEEITRVCKIFYKYKNFLGHRNYVSKSSVVIQCIKNPDENLDPRYEMKLCHDGRITEFNTAGFRVDKKNCTSLKGLSPLALAYKLMRFSGYDDATNIVNVVNLLNGTYEKEALIEQKMITNSEKEGNNNKCVICMDLTEQIMLRPCKHVCVCENCNADLEICPVCKTQIISTERVFIS
jgi:hypothetical protein